MNHELTRNVKSDVVYCLHSKKPVGRRFVQMSEKTPQNRNSIEFFLLGVFHLFTRIESKHMKLQVTNGRKA